MSNNDMIRQAVEAAERAETPYILFPEDLAVRLRIPVDFARSAIRDGRLGPWLTVGGEPAVTRDSLKESFNGRMSRSVDEDRELLREPSGRPNTAR